MKARLTNSLVACVSVLILALLGVVIGADVIVQNGDLTVDDDLDVAGFVDAYYVDAPYVRATDSLASYGSMGISDFGLIGSYLAVGGKVTSCGGYDPPYVLYDRQTREEIIERIKAEVPPEKQGGAALFFNKDTKRLETYIASEGKFYDLQGNVVYSLGAIEQPTTQYETVYYLDSSTGEVKTWQKPVYDRYVLKKGFPLDKRTGEFVDESTGEVVPKEMAIEVRKGF